MPENLSKNNKLIVISDTGMCLREGKMVALGPVVLELTAMLEVFESIVWVGFNRLDQVDNRSYIEITSDKIQPVLLKRVGGPGFINKLKIVLHYPKMLLQINKQIEQHEIIHCRAPSNPAFIVMLLSFFYGKKKIWFKYAGSWVGKTPWFYNLQRLVLKNLPSNCVVTINGQWPNQPKHCLTFENPCLTENERENGLQIVKHKDFVAPFTFCFVGRLEDAKGVQRIIDAFGMMDRLQQVKTLHFIGDGEKRDEYRKQCDALGLPAIFHGFLERSRVFEIYKEAQFILLPSDSEGFPKVIAEAMNFGCLPIVSDISSIGQYVSDDNGFLISPNNGQRLRETIEGILSENENRLKKMASNGYTIASKFTFANYNDKIQKEIIQSYLK